jgi:hypothetical protein
LSGALVAGLRSGDADSDGDGLITVTELYDYAEEVVHERESRQSAGLWVVGGEGRIVLGRSPRGARIDRKLLPADLEAALQSGRPNVRIGAVADLAGILAGDDTGLAMAARRRLARCGLAVTHRRERARHAAAPPALAGSLSYASR